MFFFLVRPGWDYLVAARRRDVSSVAGKLALRGSFRTSPARAPSVCSSNFHLPFPVLSSPLSLQPSGDSLLSTLSSSAVSSSSCLRHGTRHRFASESRSSLSVFSGLQSPSLKTMQNSSGATPGPQLEFSACASIGRRDGGFAPSGASTADPFVGVTSVQGSHSPQRRSVRFPLCPRSSSLAAPTRRLSALRSSSFSAYFSVPRACAPALRRSLDFHSVSPRNVLHSAEQRRSLVEVKFAQQKGKDTSQVPFKVRSKDTTAGTQRWVG